LRVVTVAHDPVPALCPMLSGADAVQVTVSVLGAFTAA